MTDFDQLIERARNADDSAIDELLRNHLGAIRAIVRLKAGPGVLDKESVADLTQSVCREVIQSLQTFEEGGEQGFRRWLHTLVLRKLYDRQRRLLAAQRDVRREVDYDETPSAWNAACQAFDTPSHAAMGREAQERIDAAFAKLESDQQDIIVWSRFLGMSHEEMAERLGKSETATRKMLSRALLRLAEHLER